MEVSEFEEFLRRHKVLRDVAIRKVYLCPGTPRISVVRYQMCSIYGLKVNFPRAG